MSTKIRKKPKKKKNIKKTKVNFWRNILNEVQLDRKIMIHGKNIENYRSLLSILEKFTIFDVLLLTVKYILYNIFQESFALRCVCIEKYIIGII